VFRYVGLGFGLRWEKNNWGQGLSPKIFNDQSYSRATACCWYLTSNQNLLIYTTHIKKLIDRLHFFILRSKITEKQQQVRKFAWQIMFNTGAVQRWPESLFQTPTPLLFQNFCIRGRIRVQLFFKFENPFPVQTPVTIIDATVIYPCFYLRNDHTDSCYCRNWKVTLDPGPIFHKFLTPGSDPVSSEISDLLLFFGYFASQNKEITSGNSFLDVCCVN